VADHTVKLWCLVLQPEQLQESAEQALGVEVVVEVVLRDEAALEEARPGLRLPHPRQRPAAVVDVLLDPAVLQPRNARELTEHRLGLVAGLVVAREVPGFDAGSAEPQRVRHDDRLDSPVCPQLRDGAADDVDAFGRLFPAARLRSVVPAAVTASKDDSSVR
jgi:hypothetical protein